MAGPTHRTQHQAPRLAGPALHRAVPGGACLTLSMALIEVAMEVQPVSEELERALVEGGLRVIRDGDSTRVLWSFEAIGNTSVRAQAHAAALDLRDAHGLELRDTRNMTLRDPRGDEDIRPDLLIAEAREVREREAPLPRKHGWLERIGLGGTPERDGQIIYWERRPLE